MGIKQKTISLQARGSNLASPFFQLNVLNNAEIAGNKFEKFAEKIETLGLHPLRPTKLEIFQINIGKLCNQSCAHCHVDAGPDRKVENMDKPTLERCFEIIQSIPSIHTVDITGGAPEMNPHFRWFVKKVSSLNVKVINRCNLTIIVANPKYHDLPNFFQQYKVHIISSLPYFAKQRTDSQRGDGVFQSSIVALQQLNEVGYGKVGSGLLLDLVYNPSGIFLPTSQASLEAEFKRQLNRKYGIEFNSLFTITNLPISRFLDYLLESGNYEAYMTTLVDAFNPATVAGLMCRNTISVSWDGYLYDCDFNQMLDLKIACATQHINNFDINALNNRAVVTNQHCYGCTAGAGSSCGGELV